MVFSPSDLAPGQRPYTVREVVRVIRKAIEVKIPRAVNVVGEIADYKRNESSGHLYFALRDGEAMIRAVMFAGDALYLRFAPRNGLQVEAVGLVDIYEKQGLLQLKVSAMAPAGRGALAAALEALKEKLNREGLFALERKRPLPPFARTVGLVTSPSGAAFHDFVRLLRGRAPGVRILLAPATVQGPGAAASIAAAIALHNRCRRADVLIVGRGGGALEDLWAFNEEPVVRAIAASAIPVVSAVGHETDVTLADLVADARAATPSHAAEMVVPETRRLRARVGETERRLRQEITARLAAERRRLGGLRGGYAFRRPAQAVAAANQRLDELDRALGAALSGRSAGARRRLSALAAALPPALGVRRARAMAGVERALLRMRGAVRGLTPERAARLEGLAGRLDALGPGQVLSRGYALVRRADGRIVPAAADLAPAERLRLDFHDGHATVDVRDVQSGGSMLDPGAPTRAKETG